MNPIGFNNDITYHSFRALREKRLATDSSNGLRRTQTMSNVTQSTETSEVPANNVPISSKKHNSLLSLFGRKNRDSGGNTRAAPMD